MEVANTITYYNMAIITAIKSLIVQATGSSVVEHLTYDAKVQGLNPILAQGEKNDEKVLELQVVTTLW